MAYAPDDFTSYDNTYDNFMNQVAKFNSEMKQTGVGTDNSAAPITPLPQVPAAPTVGGNPSVPASTPATPATGGNAPTTWTAKDGKVFTDQNAYVAYEKNLADAAAAANKATTDAQAAATAAVAGRQSAYDLLAQEFNKYGLGDLVTPLKGLIQQNVNPSEFALQLRNTPAYQARFAANADRVKAGLKELSPAEYVALEDQYQSIMRNYGLPESYYTPGTAGKQSGFDKLIAGDVSAAELEDRVATAQKRVLNAPPQVTEALKQFYPDLNPADILAYSLDPKNALEAIKRKVTAAEIGGAQLGAGLAASAAAAQGLANAGVTGAQYNQAAPFIQQAAQAGSQLASIYGQTPYGQTQAEQEALGLAGGAQAAAQRKKLTQLEQANFSGQSGMTQGALSQNRAGAF